AWLVQHPGPAAPHGALARSARHGPVRGEAALVGANEGRQEEIEFGGRQAGQSQQPPPVAPKFRVVHHETNVFLNTNKVYYAEGVGYPSPESAQRHPGHDRSATPRHLIPRQTVRVVASSYCLDTPLLAHAEETMKTCSVLAAAALLLSIAKMNVSLAGPITAKEAQRRAQVLEQLKKALAAETTDAARFTHIVRVLKGERAVDLRRQILDTATKIPGPELEKFLTNYLTSEEDAGLRSQAATTLGRM